MPVREVAFELECFEWADERLVVAGRWKGLAGRRLARPVLSIDTGTGRRKRLVALPGGHLGVAEDVWRAAFDWPGDPTEIVAAELEVGGSVAVDLPLPDRRRRRRKRAPVEGSDEALRNEAIALRAQVERLRAELAGRERENMQLRAQLDEEDEGGDEPGTAAPTVEIERLASEREELSAELARLAGERDQTRVELAAEIERLEGERAGTAAELEQLRAAGEHSNEQLDVLREAIAEAAAEAEAVRDRHRAELAALQDDLVAERAQVARLRIELEERPALPPPATESARAAAASAPPPAPDKPPGQETQPLPLLQEAASLPGGLDPPGPLRAGARPATQPGTGARIQSWLRATAAPPRPVDEEPDDIAVRSAAPPRQVDEESDDDAVREAAPARAGTASLQALKSRLEQLFSSNGHAADEVEPKAVHEDAALPGPRRTATAARARAGASFAARSNQAEVWGLRILAVVLVAVLLIALLLLLTSVA